MALDLHKSATPLRFANVSHPGILTAVRFQHGYSLHCYEPADDLKPFVVHIWVQRRLAGEVPAPLEIQTGPNIYLFINANEAYIHGVHSQTFAYDASSTVWVGVKFQPGGLRAFWQRTMVELADRTIPARDIFGHIDDTFCKRLVTMNDEDIVHVLESLLRQHAPCVDTKLRQVADAMRVVALADVEQVSDVVRMTGLKERSLQVLFREYVGVSLQWVLTRKRLLAAIHSTHTTWADAAAMHGYSSQSHFIRAFKDATGMVPSAYVTYDEREYGL